ncbi:unnamed protein product [marine sediment metagenome]|uniref:Glycosyl hydrolase family 13 catalytic domain-containing protein n=1 Tax=marine sediment metagenome TaxID=412755 RepID=X1B6U0_9ZZZZ
MGNFAEVKRILKKIYGDREGELAFQRIMVLLENFPVVQSKREGYFSQEDVVLITYGDSLLGEGQIPLVTLHDFANTYLKDAISTVHFLPFFPWSSDDGFSVIDFSTINPELGSWEEVVAIGRDFQLMFDYVVNHFSSKGEWFENYLAGKEGYVDFAMEVDPSTDLSMVTRPRSLPLLSEYKKHDGSTVHLWTTFSADQIDFNFRSLDVLEKMIEVLLLYAQKGATILRLDVENLMSELKDPESFRSRIFYSYIDLIKIRKKQQAFHPNADFKILEIDPKVFAIKRYCKEQTIYALTNISSKDLSVSLSGNDVAAQMTDLITGDGSTTMAVTIIQRFVQLFGTWIGFYRCGQVGNTNAYEDVSAGRSNG